MLCKCGQPGLVTLEVDRQASVSNNMPFGRYPCRDHLREHYRIRAAEIAEWLEYFKGDVPWIPHYPRTEDLKHRLKDK